MKITLRKKKIANGKESLYLDIYVPELGGKRSKEYLKLYLKTNTTNKNERNINKFTYELAENIRATRLIELQNEAHGFSAKDSKKINFIGYFAELTEKRKESTGNYGNWDSVHKHLVKFAGKKVPFAKINSVWLNRFKDYLKNEARTKSNLPLAQNSCYSYFNKVRACLKQAMKDKIILYNPAVEVEGFKQAETEREFLTLEELKAVSKVECAIPILKTAFIFSALTGLRWSDINKLVWQEVQYSEELGWYIRFRQQKTKGVETLPISQQARDLLGEKDNAEERVFNGLRYSAWYNMKLQQWVMKAGISKTITFHCARHTYATLQLTMSTDIYTVSKLLGHRDLKTTQVYANIINEKKVEAANIILNLNS